LPLFVCTLRSFCSGVRNFFSNITLYQFVSGISHIHYRINDKKKLIMIAETLGQTNISHLSYRQLQGLITKLLAELKTLILAGGTVNPEIYQRLLLLYTVKNISITIKSSP
jgi:hypothetical protein